MPKETMTSCERIMKALAFKEPDRVPLDTRISDAEIVERTKKALGRDAGRYLEGDTLFIRFKDKTNDEVFRKYLGDLPEGAAIDNWGVGLVPQKGPKDRTLAPVEIRPLENVNALEQLKEYPFPDMTEDWRHSHLEEAVREGRARGKAVVGQMSQTILESSYRMRGIERLFVDFYANPDYVDCLFDLFTESRVFMAKRFAEAGVDILRIGDDIATQRSLLISPHMYRERLKERHRDVIAAARKIKPGICLCT